jgi:hypothetical protein
MPHAPRSRRDDDIFRWAAYFIRGLIKVAKPEHDKTHGTFCICENAQQWLDDVLEVNHGDNR